MQGMMSAAVLLEVCLHSISIECFVAELMGKPALRHVTKKINQKLPVHAIVEAQPARRRLDCKLSEPGVEGGLQRCFCICPIWILPQLRDNSRSYEFTTAS